MSAATITNPTTVVAPAGEIFPGRLSAFVVLDGQATTWHCGHLHQSEIQAARCLKPLADEAARWVGAPLTSVRDDLFEARLGATTRRFRQGTR